ncbi:MAG: hypothetical protein KGD64_11425, partial [Candidatus Heimdallarchaeota archaeon]|nr:hypothetical protein [Candidatus Heimdallarchaeota archaeon]
MKILEEFHELSSKITNTPITLREEDFINVNKNPIIDHIKRYPRLEWQDIYKFIFQGSCGWTHLSTNSSEKKVVQYLNNELTLASKPLPDEQLFESLNNST